MSVLLSKFTRNKNNNFNLLRFVAASLVLFSHSFALSLGSGNLEPLRSSLNMTWGTIAVDIFFATSGFLITSSYLSRNNLISFAWARLLRIYTVLIMANLACVFIVVLFFTSYDKVDYLSNFQTYEFLFKNSILFFNIDYTLQGVFENNICGSAVNGNLWTLPYEIFMYVILAIILVIIRLVQKKRHLVNYKIALLLIFIISIALHISNYFQPMLPENLVRLFYVFFVGSTIYVRRDSMQLSFNIFVIALLLVLLSAINKDIFFILYFIFLPYLVFYLAYVPSGIIRKFNNLGDYSYGMYIYAFPVQQSIVALFPTISVANLILESFIVTLLLSIFSWHFIDKNALKMKSSYVVIESFLYKYKLLKKI